MDLRFLISFIFPTIFLATAEVLVVGDALVDHIIFVEEEYLKTIPGNKGGSQLIEETLLEKILTEKDLKAHMSPGGSSINIMKGLSHLGHRCRVVSKIGTDLTGDFFLSALTRIGIEASLKRVPTQTGQSICFVTPDGDRTMRTFLGACTHRADLDLSPTIYEGIKLFHLEGYQLHDEAFAKILVTKAKDAGAKISMDLASFEIVQAHRELILDLLSEIDILFCNKDEASALTGLSPKEACQWLGERTPMVVVTAGKEGAYALRGKEFAYQHAFEAFPLDTTGAGDYFASGVLHGYLTGKSLTESLRFGAILASHVISIIGAEIPPEQWTHIRQEIHE